MKAPSAKERMAPGKDDMSQDMRLMESQSGGVYLVKPKKKCKRN